MEEKQISWVLSLVFTEEANMFTGFKYKTWWVNKQQDTSPHCCVCLQTVMAELWP